MLGTKVAVVTVAAICAACLAPLGAASEEGEGDPGRDCIDAYTGLAQYDGLIVNAVTSGGFVWTDRAGTAMTFGILTPIEEDHGFVTVEGYVSCAVAQFGDLVDCVRNSLTLADVTACIEGF